MINGLRFMISTLVRNRRGCGWVIALGCAVLVLGTSGCTKQAKVYRHLSRAKSDMAAGQYEKAEVEYLRVLQLTPGNATAVTQLGNIYYDEGRFPQAVFYLNNGVGLAPNDAKLRVKLSLAQLSLMDVLNARTNAEIVLQKEPGQEDALSVLADASLTLKQVQDTFRQIEELRKRDQDRSSYHLALGALYLKQGQMTNCAVEFDKALQLDPKSAAVNMAVGKLYWLSNDLGHAEQYLKAGADLSPVRSSRRLAYADFKLKTGGREEAEKMLEEINRQAPDFIPAWNFRAQLAFSQNKLDECAELLQKVLSKDRINYEGSLLDASVKVRQNRIKQAIDELTRLGQSYTRSSDIQLRLAQCYVLNGEQAKAEGAIKQALALNPSSPEAILADAELSISKGDPVSAELALEQLISRRPDLAQAHLLLAAAYVSQKDYEHALGVYRRLQRFYPKGPRVPYLIATVLAAQDKRDEARQACAEALRLDPDFLPPLEELVNLDIEDKKPEAALGRVNKEIERRPTVPELQLLLGKVYLSQTNVSQGEVVMSKAMQMAPDSRMPYLMLAQLYVTAGKAQEALEKLNGFVARTNDVAALMEIGIIQETLTNYVAAREAYEKLLSVNPRFAAAQNNLAYLYCENFNELDKAVKLAEAAHQMYPGDPSAADTLGWVVYRKHDYLRALSLISQASAGAPEEAEIQYHLGMVRYELGQEAEARVALQKGVDGEKRFAGKEEARRRLAILAIDPNSPDPASQALLEKRVAEDPEDPVALVRLAAIYKGKGNTADALKAYQQALAGSPGNAGVLTNLAQLYAAPGSLNDSKKAVDYAKQAHAAAPDDTGISQLLGHLVCQAGDYKWASSLLQDAAFRTPDEPQVQFDLARAYYGLGQVDSALSAAQKAVAAGDKFAGAGVAKRFVELVGAYRGSPGGTPGELAGATPAPPPVPAATDENYVPTLMLKGAIERSQGKYNEARKTLEQVLAAQPKFPLATRDLAVLAFEHFSDEPKIFELATQARDAFPDDAGLAKVLGVLTYQRGDYAAAARFLRQSLAARKSDPDVYYYLGLAQYAQKAKLESKTSLQQALALNLEGKRAEDARRILAEMK